MTDHENQQPQDDAEAEATRYWNEAVGTTAPVPGDEESQPQDAVEGEEGEKTEDKSDEGEGDEAIDDASVPDPWGTVPDDLRQEYESIKEKANKLEHASRSANGRLGAMQKKIDELSRKLADVSSQPAKDEKTDSPEVPGETIFKTEAWKKFRDDFGDVATPIEDAIRASYTDLHSRLSETTKVSTTLQEQRLEEIWAHEALKLEDAWPGWKQFTDDNYEEFESFVNASPARQQMMQPNLQRITDAQAGLDLLYLFKAHLDRKSGNGHPPLTTPQPRPAMTQKRQKQLESAATVAPRSHPAPGRRSDDLPEPDDREAAWKYFSAKATR